MNKQWKAMLLCYARASSRAARLWRRCVLEVFDLFLTFITDIEKGEGEIEFESVRKEVYDRREKSKKQR